MNDMAGDRCQENLDQMREAHWRKHEELKAEVKRLRGELDNYEGVEICDCCEALRERDEARGENFRLQSEIRRLVKEFKEDGDDYVLNCGRRLEAILDPLAEKDTSDPDVTDQDAESPLPTPPDWMDDGKF